MRRHGNSYKVNLYLGRTDFDLILLHYDGMLKEAISVAVKRYIERDYSLKFTYVPVYRKVEANHLEVTLLFKEDTDKEVISFIQSIPDKHVSAVLRRLVFNAMEQPDIRQLMYTEGHPYTVTSDRQPTIPVFTKPSTENANPASDMAPPPKAASPAQPPQLIPTPPPATGFPSGTPPVIDYLSDDDDPFAGI